MKVRCYSVYTITKIIKKREETLWTYSKSRGMCFVRKFSNERLIDYEKV